ncbi:MAG: DUF4160 domain-containing protein [Elusimicrobiota bacterium]
MPKISEFFGISIYVYYREHQPPHFHALYAGEEILVSVKELSVMGGAIHPRAIGMVIEWAALHQKELLRVWEQAVKQEPLSAIEPLE